MYYVFLNLADCDKVMHIAILGDRPLSMTRHHRKQMIEFVSGTIYKNSWVSSAGNNFAVVTFGPGATIHCYMTSVHVVETLVANKTSFQKYHYPDDHKPFTICTVNLRYFEYLTLTSFVSLPLFGKKTALTA